MHFEDMKEREGKYWICSDCAKAKGWKSAYPNGGNTVIRGMCGHCDRKDETFLIPTRDFKKTGERTPSWD